MNKDKKLYVVVSQSSAGKDLLFNRLIQSEFFMPCISHTTRPMRDNEINGHTYHFIGKYTFKEMELDNQFIETRQYNVIYKDSNKPNDIWYYGLSKNASKEGNLVIVDLQGLEALEKEIGKENIVSVYLKVKPSTRLARSIKRQDIQINEEYKENSSVTMQEITRRFIDDMEKFKDVENKVDYVLDNEDLYQLDQNVRFFIDLIIKYK
jgi:guanylate kinase